MPLVRSLITTLVGASALALAAPAFAGVREIGYPTPFPEASCPTNCQAIGKVSGYQVQLGKHKNPFEVNRPGKIVAFTIRLGKPSADQIQFFTNLFGGEPEARLSVLSTLKRGRKAKLVGQSEIFKLGDYYGSTPTFALSSPLDVPAHSTIALTVPTWAPAFAVDLGSDQAWRSSRPKSDCNDVQKGADQERLHSVVAYQCFYRTARVLYSATFVPTPKPTTKKRSRH